MAVLGLGLLLGLPVFAGEYERPQAETPAVTHPVPKKTARVKKPSRKVAANKKFLKIQGEDVELAPAPLMIQKP
jgi:hypothetical protein